MKYADISGLSGKDLNKKATEARATMFEARMKNSLGQLANPMTIREARRDIARLKTAAAAKSGKAPQRKMNRADRLAATAQTIKSTAVKAKTAAKGK